jgi:hypothetical protein
MKLKLPADTATGAEVDLCQTAGDFFLQARLNVSLPGLEREVAPGLGARRAPDVSVFQSHTEQYRSRGHPGLKKRSESDL